MKALTPYKIQFYLYLFIIAFSLQHFFFREFNYRFDWYEGLVSGILMASIVVVLISVFILIAEAVISINRKDIHEKEIKYLVLNLILYYAAIASSLCMIGELRR